jgi:hypothetical protein
VANLPREKLQLLSGLMPWIPDPVPESALDPSVNQIRASAGISGYTIYIYHGTELLVLFWYMLFAYYSSFQ